MRDANSDAHSYGDINADIDGHSNSNGHSDSDSDSYRYGYSYSNSNGNGNGYTYCAYYSNTYTHVRPRRYSWAVEHRQRLSGRSS